jgi:hypothetical protein
MELLVEFELDVLGGTPATEVERRKRTEASSSAWLADTGHLVRLRGGSANGRTRGDRPDPRLTRPYRLEAAVRSGGG